MCLQPPQALTKAVKQKHAVLLSRMFAASSGPVAAVKNKYRMLNHVQDPPKVRLSGLVSWSTVLHCTVKATATVHQLTPDPKLKPQLSVIGAVSSSSRILSNRRQTTISVFFCR